MHMQG